jgi:serine/threonine-protein kinase
VLLAAHQRNPALVQRFVEEAQIGGQLQHPGVVPVYELGLLPDRRPFIAMKLVKETLFTRLDRALRR